MIEPPSKPLRETLLRLRICTAADFRRAKRRVRRLARDLPAFDFIWIDALLNLRRLTPFQARLLETNKVDGELSPIGAGDPASSESRQLVESGLMELLGRDFLKYSDAKPAEKREVLVAILNERLRRREAGIYAFTSPR